VARRDLATRRATLELARDEAKPRLDVASYARHHRSAVMRFKKTAE
jgi:hypothetical protein